MVFIPARWRHVGGTLGLLFILHLILSISPSYREHTSLGIWPSGWGEVERPEGQWAGAYKPTPSDAPQMPSADDLRAMKDSPELRNRRKVRAAFVVLVRDEDLWEMTTSMQQLEDRFNHWAQYDWVFLNDGDFSDQFKRYTQALTGAKCKYGKIAPEVWNQPEWIDEDKAAEAREHMTRMKVIYAHSIPYRNMCRFNSGGFYNHPVLDDYDYYWRVEPGVKFFCDLNYDPFLVMKDNNKVYGFNVALIEYIETIPTLWKTTKDFIEKHPEYVAKDNAMDFISDDGGESYNRCHFWSNFEIGDLRFWRSEAYQAYFDYLDRSGGFYYERWGDAPVHSIAVALFAGKDQLHWFDDIGYRHEPFQHCPSGDAHERGRCSCDPGETADWEWYSCASKYIAMFPDAGKNKD